MPRGTRQRDEVPAAQSEFSEAIKKATAFATLATANLLASLFFSLTSGRSALSERTSVSIETGVSQVFCDISDMFIFFDSFERSCSIRLISSNSSRCVGISSRPLPPMLAEAVHPRVRGDIGTATLIVGIVAWLITLAMAWLERAAEFAAENYDNIKYHLGLLDESQRSIGSGSANSFISVHGSKSQVMLRNATSACG